MQVQFLNIGSGIDAYRVTHIDYLPGSKRGAFTRIQVNTRLYGYIVNTIAVIQLVTGRNAERQPRRSVRSLELYGFCLVRPGNELAVIQVERLPSHHLRCEEREPCNMKRLLMPESVYGPMYLYCAS